MTNTTNTVQEFTRRGIDRRTVIKGAAWSVPVIAVAAAAPLAAASTPPPVATYAEVSSTSNPRAGSNPTFSAIGQYLENGNYVDGATLKAGTSFVLTFTGGATGTSITVVAGLTLVSGNPTTGGPVTYVVTADTTAKVSLRVNGVQPAGGTITATVLGGSASSTIIA